MSFVWTHINARQTCLSDKFEPCKYSSNTSVKLVCRQVWPCKKPFILCKLFCESFGRGAPGIQLSNNFYCRRKYALSQSAKIGQVTFASNSEYISALLLHNIKLGTNHVFIFRNHMSVVLIFIKPPCTTRVTSRAVSRASSSAEPAWLGLGFLPLYTLHKLHISLPVFRYRQHLILWFRSSGSRKPAQISGSDRSAQAEPRVWLRGLWPSSQMPTHYTELSRARLVC